MISGISFSWRQLNQPQKVFEEEFQQNTNKNLQDLSNELDQDADSISFSAERAYTVIGLLCSKETPCIEEKIQQQFFKAIRPLLEKKTSIGILERIRCYLTYENIPKKNSKLTQLCSEAIKNDKPKLAEQIVQLFSDSELFTDDQLVYDALKKGKHFTSFIKDRIEKLPPERRGDYINRGVCYHNLLMFALEEGDDDLIPFFIHYGAKVDVEDDRRGTLLSFAIEKKKPVNILQEIILHMNDFTFKDRKKNNFLLLAIKNNLTQIIPLLWDKVKINHQDEDGNTALHLAVAAGLIPEAVELIKRGADPLLKNCCGRSPLLLAAGSEVNNPLVLAMLDQLDLTGPSLQLAVLYAFDTVVKRGYTQGVQRFFDRGFSLAPESKQHALKEAIKGGHEETALFLLTPEIINGVAQATFNLALTNKLSRLALRFLESFEVRNDPIRFWAACQEGSSELVSTFIEKYNWQKYKNISKEMFSVDLEINALFEMINREDLQAYVSSMIRKLLECKDYLDLFSSFLFTDSTLAKQKATTAFVEEICSRSPDSEILVKLNEMLIKAVIHQYDPIIPLLIEKGAGKNIDYSLRVNNPTVLLRFCRLILNDPFLCKELGSECVESLFIQLLQNFDQLNLVHIQNVKEILGDKRVKLIAEKFLTSLIQESTSDQKREKTTELTLQKARKLGELFPTEATLRVQLQEGSMEVNPFILVVASPVFRVMLSEKWRKGIFELNLSLVHFKKIYDYLLKNILDFSEIEDEESQKVFKAIFDFYQIEPPSHFCKGWGKITSLDVLSFLERPYKCINKNELTISSSLFTDDTKFICDLKSYFKYHPHINKLKIEVDEQHPVVSSSQLELPELQEIHIDYRNSDIELEFLGFNNFSVFLTGIKNLSNEKLNNFIGTCKIVGLDLSNRLKFELSFNSFYLRKLQYLNLSNTPISYAELSNLLKNSKRLMELVLTNCQCVNDDNLSSLGEMLPCLTSIHLDGNFVTGPAVIRFVREAFQLESIHLPQFSDELLKEVAQSSKQLSVYVGKKRVWFDEDFIRKIDFLELIELAAQEDLYFLESDVSYILNCLFNKIRIKEKLPTYTKNAFINLLGMIKTRERQVGHPLSSFIKKLTDVEDLIDFSLILSDHFQDHTLDEYLPEEEVSALYHQFLELAEKKQLSLEQVRKLSKLFRIAAEIEVLIEGSASSYHFHPLVLLGASKTLSEMFRTKICCVNEFVMSYIHAYLQEGKVNLKKMDLGHYLEICEILEKYELSIDHFLQAAEGHEINLILKPDITQEMIHNFLAHPVLKSSVSMIDIDEVNLDPTLIAELVNEIDSLKKIRLPARLFIKNERWDAFIKKGTDMTLVFNCADEVQYFNTLYFKMFADNKCQIRLDFKKDARFSSLSEYLTFAQKIPALAELDLSGFPPCKGAEELQLLSQIFQKNPPKSLNLGNCLALTEKELNDIARCCLGLKLLKDIGDPKLLGRVFSHHTTLDSCEIEELQTSASFFP